MYMSYCAFEGTASELEQCIDFLCEQRELSEDERSAAIRLIGLCERYICEAGNYGLEE